jgi:HEPN domain-containing protein
MAPPTTPAQAFLAKAREDLRQVSKNKDDAETSVEQFGFFCQQAVEKSLKAVLTFRAIRFRKGHDIATYLDLLRAGGVAYPMELDEATALTPFAAELRYDFLLPEELDVTPFDREAAARLAGLAVEWASSLVKGA